LDLIKIRGASEHNLKRVSLDLPRDRFTVFTGISGSGKSSLAFDTLYKEGRRRFLESLSSYARRFLGGFDKPDVESIEGLSPAVSIEQKTIGRSPRSTVGTMTEAYDYLRLLYARLGEPHCPRCGRRIEAQSAERIVDSLLLVYSGHLVLLCAPIVRGRKGEYRREIEALQRDGYRRLRVDGRVVELGEEELRLSRRTTHTIEVVYDRIQVDLSMRSRLLEAVEKCVDLSGGLVNVVVDEPQDAEAARGTPPPAGGFGSPDGGHLFSSRFACPECRVDLPALEPRFFSFNRNEGACPLCQGFGRTRRLDPELLIADPGLPLGRGGLAAFDYRGRPVRPQFDAKVLDALAARGGFQLSASWADLSEEQRRILLAGDDGHPGLVRSVEAAAADAPNFYDSFFREFPCLECGGARLGPLARAVTFRGRSLPELCAESLGSLRDWFASLEADSAERLILDPILRELRPRLKYLCEVGLAYLTLNRGADTLAGGEAQRIRLASQVGSGLQGVLVVLDEPSIGLHPRDNRKLLQTLQRLRDLGNTVVVVEHDLETMLAADHLVDIGPGAGVQGGEVVAEGSRLDLARAERSLTGAYLSGAKAIEVPSRRRAPGKKWLELHDVRHNNLKGIDARFPLGLFVVVTGVSGSGKSSLVHQVLRPALLRKLRRVGPDPGRHGSLRGNQHIDALVDIDQSPIGRTPRSNPATYTKVFGPIRDLFAKLPESRARGYAPGRFSFNTPGGRCMECNGAGVQIVDLQFLAPVEVVCEICEGKRYNRETLEVLLRGKSIYDILNLTVAEALDFFRDYPQMTRILSVLAKVGLGYVRLGQTATTLSGGEAQRLKLASELRRRDTGRTLYILDEPTTGLHFEDVRHLLDALQELVDRGNSVIVIEHNLEVVQCADYIVDLGPEGGEEGGRIVAVGPPEEVARCPESHTGEALAAWLGRDRTKSGGLEGSEATGGRSADARSDRGDLVVEGASLHNLRDVSVRIPKNRMTVVTGPSGSGKTSLAFDTVFAEGQRRYVDSLSTYARQFLGRLQRPPVRGIRGLAPAIAIDQTNAAGGLRSTVATTTEIHDYLRLLYAHVGTPHCPRCDEVLGATSPSKLAKLTVETREGERLEVLAPIELRADSEPELGEQLSGLLRAGFTRVKVRGQELRLDADPSVLLRQVLNALRSSGVPRAAGEATEFLVVDRLVVRGDSQTRLAGSLEQAFGRGGGSAALGLESEPIPSSFTLAPSCPRGHFRLGVKLTPRLFSFNSAEGACPRCRGTGEEQRADANRIFILPGRPVLQAINVRLMRFLEDCRPSALLLARAFLRSLGKKGGSPYEDLSAEHRQLLLYGREEVQVPVILPGGEYQATWPGLLHLLETWAEQGDPVFAQYHLGHFFSAQVCSVCEGRRLRPEALAVRVGGLRLHELVALRIDQCRRFFADLCLDEREKAIAADALREVQNRLRFLDDVGLGYLSLDRVASTLSGGEAQRIRLASQLGNRLVGVIYVLDEPTVGLHQRDTQRLLGSLQELRDQGNTIILVEHDRETIEAADHLIDLGPGAGENGGRVVACGTLAEVRDSPESLTGRYLRGAARVSDEHPRREPGETRLELRGVRCHNLEDLDVDFPLGLFTAVTGVSGSGKSSLVMDVLCAVLQGHMSGVPGPPELVREIRGLEHVERAVVIDQRPIGRTPKSTPATYTGLWDRVRDLFASLPLAKAKGFTPSRFSFNSPEGSCMFCGGQGAVLVEMQFLSDVWVKCEYCKGRRFDEATLEVRFKGKTVNDVLDMGVQEAAELFANHPRVAGMLATLQAVGLGYVKLGQAASTLSGGEAQRVKLAAELAETRHRGTVYILDEPTTGLHLDDVRKLVAVLQRLVSAGNTVVLIEHHLDVIAAADWVIDLGPEAASDGGRIVAEGTPEDVARIESSHTGRCLRRVLDASPPAREPVAVGG
jgi:excinuclease ABC subunit A